MRTCGSFNAGLPSPIGSPFLASAPGFMVRPAKRLPTAWLTWTSSSPSSAWAWSAVSPLTNETSPLRSASTTASWSL